MNVLVCIKQVPDNSVVPKLDPNTNRVVTEGVELMESPFDLNAVEAGLKLVEESGGEVSVLTLGGESAKTSLRYGLSMGAAKAYLLKDPAFEESDSWGTSYGLAKAIQSIGNFDVILCGKQAIDGDTAQVGPEMAEHMDLPHVTLATGVEMADGKLRVQRDTDEGHDIIEVDLPALVTVTKTSYDPRYPSIKSKMAANRAVITEITNSDPDMICDQERLGLNGSPTKVKKTFTPDQTKNGVIISNETGPDAAAKLAAMLSDAKII